MSLSIIVPMLNEEAGIAAALSALRDLGGEIVAVDGGSRDKTLACAGPHADQLLSSPRGRARQMNAGAASAQGEILLFLHADTTLPANAAQAIMEAIGQGAVWGRFDVCIAGNSAWFPLIAALMNLRSRLTGIATGDQAMFMTRAAFEAAGGYPEQPLMEDIELSKRLKRLGPPACLRQRVVTSGRRWEQHGVWRTILLMWRLRFDYWRGVPAEQLAARYHPHAPR